MLWIINALHLTLSAQEPAAAAKEAPGAAAKEAPGAAATTQATATTGAAAGLTKAGAAPQPAPDAPDTGGNTKAGGGGAIGEGSPFFLPLVSVTGSTDKEGELKLSPSLWTYSAETPGLGVLIAPFFKASTKSGAVEVPLTRIAETPGLGFGGSLSFYALYTQPAAPASSCGPDDASSFSGRWCSALELAKQYCDLAVGWDPAKKVGARCDGDNKVFCDARKAELATFQFNGKLCPVGETIFTHWLDQQPQFQEHARRSYPKYVITVGAAAQPAKFSHLIEGDTGWTKKETRAWSVDAGLAGAFVLEKGWGRGVARTLEFTATYAGRSTAASKTGKWCIAEDKPFTTGDESASIERCAEAPLGAPSRSHQVSASLLLGALDVIARRYRFSIGPTVSLAPYQSYFVGIEAPVVFRLTPEAWRGYTGGYSGMLRIRPVLGALGTSAGVSFRALLVLELQALRSLFGDRAFSWL